MTQDGVPARTSQGRSRPGRLDGVDAALVAELGAWLRSAPADAPVVDLGFGAYPWTLRSLAGAVRMVDPDRRCVGVEAHHTFAARAKTLLSGEGINVVHGGFDLPPPARGACVVRIMNVLRSYPAAEVAPALDAVAARVLDGGWVVDGACSLDGDATVTRWWQVAGGRRALRAWGFGTTLAAGYAPALFMPRLPPDAKPDWFDPGTPLGLLHQAWQKAFEVAAGRGDARARFDRTASHLGRGWPGLRATRALHGAWLQVPWNTRVTGDADPAVGG